MMLRESIDQINIVGISAAVPKHCIDNTTLAFSDINKTIQSIGVKKRRVSDDTICTSDLCFEAAKKLLTELNWDPTSVDCLIFITQTPDYFLPSTSFVLQNRLGLIEASIVLDINLGCSGYVYGLWLISQIMRNSTIKRGLLLVGDTISKIVSDSDRATFPLFGDAGSATALEKNEKQKTKMHFCLGSDGRGWGNLLVEKGNFRKPIEQNEKPSLLMNGNEIFTFTLSRVPEVIESILSDAAWTKEEIDYFVFHQANAFMLNFLRKKLKIPTEKFPMILEDFGNTSSASVPLTLVTADFINPMRKMVLAGFGVGYSWAAAAIQWQQEMLILPLLEI